MKQFTVEFLYSQKTYKVLQDFGNEIYIIGMPHRFPAWGQIYYGENDLIDTAHNIEGHEQKFCIYNKDVLIDMYDDINDVPAKAISICDSKGKVVDYNGEWVENYDGLEYEWAVDVLTDDLNSSRIFYNIDEIIDYCENGDGHKSTEAKEVMCNQLEKLGYIQESEI